MGAIPAGNDAEHRIPAGIGDDDVPAVGDESIRVRVQLRETEEHTVGIVLGFVGTEIGGVTPFAARVQARKLGEVCQEWILRPERGGLLQSDRHERGPTASSPQAGLTSDVVGPDRHAPLEIRVRREASCDPLLTTIPQPADRSGWCVAPVIRHRCRVPGEAGGSAHAEASPSRFGDKQGDMLKARPRGLSRPHITTVAFGSAAAAVGKSWTHAGFPGT